MIGQRLVFFAVATVGITLASGPAEGELPAVRRAVAVSASPNGTSYEYASAALHLRWQRPGGDYVDADGVLNGPKSSIVVPVSRPIDVEIDISSLEGDLLLRFDGGHAPGWSSPRIDGEPVEAFWVDASSNRPIGAPLKMPAFVANPGNGKRLTISLQNIYQAGRLLVDRVAPPVPPAWTMQSGGLAATVAKDAGLRGRPGVIRYLEASSEATMRKLLPRGSVADPLAYDAQWLAGPKGLPVLRASSHPANQRLISWFLRFEPQQEVYARYALLIEPDVADGMTELGVKLPGLAGGEVSWRMEHGPIAPANPGRYAALDYMYSAESGAGYPPLRSMGGVFEAGRWYSIEQYVKLNTPGQPDGVAKVWINGNLTWSSDKVRFRDKPDTRIDHLHVNIYHGGMGLPKAPIHYRIAAIAVAREYIGPPVELLP